jgi:signal transduction histidine kinase
LYGVDTSERTADLATLREIARSLASGTNSRDVLQTLCVTAAAHCAASGASVAQVSLDSAHFIATSGIAEGLLYIDFALPGTATARAVAEKRPIALSGPGESSQFFGELLPKLGTGPVLVVPLMAQDELMGVLAVFRRTGEPVFNVADMDRVATVADLAALALWKARLLEEARAADAAKTSLLATLSHELRTPLAALEGYGELLEDEILGPLSTEQREVIVRLRTVGRHLGALIEDILTFASLEADHVTVRNAPVKLEELLDSLLPYIEPLAREKNIRFSVTVDRSLPPLNTDDARVRQVLLNLCQNAVKFTENGDVSLQVEQGTPADSGEHTVRFQVTDSGIGIAPRDLQRLFRPFSQLEDVPTRRHRGTGLGLYISRRLATLLGGRIEVKSRPGTGSVFTLVLPASDERR